MKTRENIEVPTGNILIVDGDHGRLECLSLGDYGQAKNLKADFLGLTEEINGVPHGDLLPLEKKWVITISTQYGCSMGCRFCDVPKVGPGRNTTITDLIGQILAATELHPEVTSTNRLNVHFARMGEPTFNPSVIHAARWLKLVMDQTHRVHPVVSTMMPAGNKWLLHFLMAWMDVKNRLYGGEAGLQLSINSTDEAEREEMFSGNALPINSIGSMMRMVQPPHGRKITLNFALAGYTIDAEMLAHYFSPANYICKLTPMHETVACEDNNIHTPEGYARFAPYKPTEDALKAAGYDVIVFVPSLEEDRGRITCGNAILSGTRPK